MSDDDCGPQCDHGFREYADWTDEEWAEFAFLAWTEDDEAALGDASAPLPPVRPPTRGITPAGDVEAGEGE